MKQNGVGPAQRIVSIEFVCQIGVEGVRSHNAQGSWGQSKITDIMADGTVGSDFTLTPGFPGVNPPYSGR